MKGEQKQIIYKLECKKNDYVKKIQEFPSLKWNLITVLGEFSKHNKLLNFKIFMLKYRLAEYCDQILF